MEAPNRNAVGYLREHPEFAADFDEKFGAGAAETVLGEATPQAPVEATQDDPQADPQAGDAAASQAAKGLLGVEPPPDDNIEVDTDVSTVGDLGRSLLGGFLGSIENTGDLIAQGLTAINENFPVSMNINLGPGAPNKAKDAPLIEFLSAAEFNAQGGDAIFGEIGVDDNIAGESKTSAGAMVRGITQFTTDFIGVGKIFKGVKLLQGATKTERIANIATRTFAADFLAFNPQSDRVSNLISDHPGVGPAVFDFLAAREDDTNAEGRFKRALEGLGLLSVGGVVIGGAVKGFIKTLRFVRSARNRAAAGKIDEANKIIEDGAEEIATDLKLLDELAGKAPLPASKAGPVTARVVTTEKNLVDTDALLAKLDGLDEKTVTFNPLLDGGPEPIFNYAKYEGPDSAKVMMKVIGEAVSARTDKLVQNGTMTFDQIRREAAETLADTLNTSVLDITARTARIAENARDQVSVMLAGKQALQAVGRDAFHMAQKILNSGNAATDVDRVILDKMLNAMGDLEANLKAIQKSAARTTASGRITIEEIVATGGDPKAIRRLSSTWRKFINGHNEFWINAILSGPKTHLVNVTSNTIQLGLIPADRIIGGALTGDLATMRQGFKMYMGYVRAFKDANKQAFKALRTGENVLDPLYSKIDGSPRFAIHSDTDSALGSVIRGSGSLIRVPTRLLMAEDEWFKQMAFRSNLYANASMDGVERGLKGRDLAQYIEDAFEKGIDKRGRGLDDASLEVAREATFTTPLRPDTFGGKVASPALNAFPLLKPIAPFVRTPTNIFRNVIARTPLTAAFQKQMREDFFAGGARRSAAVGKVMTGAMIWGGALIFAAEGRITGAGPGDPGERERLKETGWRPYAFVTTDDDGKKSYTSFQRLDPIGMILGLAADLSNAAGKMSDGEIEEATAIMGISLAKNLTSKTYLTSITEVMDAMSRPDREFVHFMNRRAGSYIPTGIKQIADFTGFPSSDPVMREVRGNMDAILAKIPTFSATLPPDREYITGDPKEFDSVINPFATTTENPDPQKAFVLKEIARLKITIEKPPRILGEIELTDTQWDRLLVLTANPTPTRSGKKRMSLVAALEKKMKRASYDIDRKKFNDTPDEFDNLQGATKRERKVREVISKYRSKAMDLLVKEFPLLKAALKAQRKANTAQGTSNRTRQADTLKKLEAAATKNNPN